MYKRVISALLGLLMLLGLMGYAGYGGGHGDGEPAALPGAGHAADGGAAAGIRRDVRRRYLVWPHPDQHL